MSSHELLLHVLVLHMKGTYPIMKDSGVYIGTIQATLLVGSLNCRKKHVGSTRCDNTAIIAQVPREKEHIVNIVIYIYSNSNLYSTGFHNMFKSAFLSPSYRWSNHTHLNKNVLSDFLKVATEGLFLIFTGILFHSFGPHTTKLRSPNLFVHLGMCRSS